MGGLCVDTLSNWRVALYKCTSERNTPSNIWSINPNRLLATASAHLRILLGLACHLSLTDCVASCRIWIYPQPQRNIPSAKESRQWREIDVSSSPTGRGWYQKSTYETHETTSHGTDLALKGFALFHGPQCSRKALILPYILETYSESRKGKVMNSPPSPPHRGSQTTARAFFLSILAWDRILANPWPRTVPVHEPTWKFLPLFFFPLPHATVLSECSVKQVMVTTNRRVMEDVR